MHPELLPVPETDSDREEAGSSVRAVRKLTHNRTRSKDSIQA